MIIINSYASNFLYREDRTALVVVKVDPNGNPDSVSYWKNQGGIRVRHHEGVYEAGALVDMWA